MKEEKLEKVGVEIFHSRRKETPTDF